MESKFDIFKVVMSDGTEIIDKVSVISDKLEISPQGIRQWNKCKSHNRQDVKSIDIYKQRTKQYTKKNKRRIAYYHLIDVSRQEFIFEGTIEQIEMYLYLKLNIEFEYDKYVLQAFTKKILIKNRYAIIRSDKREYEQE